MLCGNINEFGVVKDHLGPQCECDPPPTKQCVITIQHTEQRFCFYILFNGYEINAYLLMYFIFNITV